MEINGILTRMMFDHDRLRHAFYVEESYVIPWMYPYLSPHGLIMKINRDQTPYDAKTAAKDRDFWDWYTRRLLDDPMYRRDFAGQKSFSKLRAAIAGLYVRQGRYREAAQAFREACLLYPASPEATFRYSQECLVPFRKWDVVLELMDYTDLIDPKNKRTAGLRGYVERVRAVTDEVRRLEALRSKGQLSDPDSLSLAHCYFEIGRARESAQIISSMADRLKDARELSMAWQILLSAGVQQDAEKLLARYLKLNPSGDANAWAELAKLQHRSGRRQAAQQSFVAGYNIDRQMMFQKIQKDQELYEIAAPLFQRRK
jgi:tetratricopeptide (TPR) repeat protein